MKYTLAILWVALQVAIASCSLQTLVLGPACSHHDITTAAVTHAAVGQPGSLNTLHICSEHNAIPWKGKGVALAPSGQCHLPSVLSGWVEQQHSKVLEEWVLLIGPNFTFNQSIAPSDFLGLESLPKLAAISTTFHMPLSPQHGDSNGIFTKNLFGTRRPPGPRLLEKRHQFVAWDELLDSPSAFLLIQSQDLMHLAPLWHQLCEAGAAARAASGDIDTETLRDRAYKAAAQELSIMHMDGSQVINKAPPAYKMVHPPAMWPQGAPEPLEVLPLAPYSSYNSAPVAREQVYTRLGVRVVYRGSKDKTQQGLPKSLSNMHVLWATRHTVRVEEMEGSIQIVDERSLFLPPAWIGLALWLAVLVALLAYELT